ISLDYSLMPPLMLACVVSVLVARKLHADSIYTEPLRDKGVTVPEETSTSDAATERTVGELMHAPVPPLRETATMGEIADRLLTSSAKLTNRQYILGPNSEDSAGRAYSADNLVR